jgi:hypothetical protein
LGWFIYGSISVVTDAEREEIEALVEWAEGDQTGDWRQARNRMIKRMKDSFKRILNNPKHFEVWSNK